MEDSYPNYMRNTGSEHVSFYFVYIPKRIFVGTFSLFFSHIFEDFYTDNFCPFLSTLLKKIQKKYFSKLSKLLTINAAEIKNFQFLKIFFSKKKIILQFSFLDIFKNVHFRNFNPDFILGVLQGFSKKVHLEPTFYCFIYKNLSTTL